MQFSENYFRIGWLTIGNPGLSSEIFDTISPTLVNKLLHINLTFYTNQLYKVRVGYFLIKKAEHLDTYQFSNHVGRTVIPVTKA